MPFVFALIAAIMGTVGIQKQKSIKHSMNALPSWYVEGRAGIESFCTPNHLIFESDPTVVWSNSKRYCLIVERYGESEKPQYTRGKVYYGKKLIADIKRNNNNFLFAWVQQDDHEYLLTGEDDQGYTVVDLENQKTTTHIDRIAEYGMGFRWTKVLPSPNGKLLAVTGVYFPSLVNTVIYSFSEPDQLPLPKLRVVDATVDNYKIVGWTNNTTLEIISNGKAFYNALTGRVKR